MTFCNNSGRSVRQLLRCFKGSNTLTEFHSSTSNRVSLIQEVSQAHTLGSSNSSSSSSCCRAYSDYAAPGRGAAGSGLRRVNPATSSANGSSSAEAAASTSGMLLALADPLVPWQLHQQERHGDCLLPLHPYSVACSRLSDVPFQPAVCIHRSSSCMHCHLGFAMGHIVPLARVVVVDRRQLRLICSCAPGQPGSSASLLEMKEVPGGSKPLRRWEYYYWGLGATGISFLLYNRLKKPDKTPEEIAVRSCAHGAVVLCPLVDMSHHCWLRQQGPVVSPGPHAG